MYCTALSLGNSGFNESSRPLRIGLLMDGVSSLLELNTSLNLHPEPVFTRFSEEMIFTSGDPIMLTIQGMGFVFTADQLQPNPNPNPNQTQRPGRDLPVYSKECLPK